MKFFAVVLLVFLLSGCFVELLTTTAIEGDLQRRQLQTAAKALNTAKGFSARTSAEQAIGAYHAETGEYPPSLDALVPEWLPETPTQPDGTPFGYDPTTGALLDGPVQPLSPDMAGRIEDEQEMARIRAAIDQFGQDTQYYPASLRVLVPNYLSEYPKTASGKDYVYDDQTGALSHPDGPIAVGQAQPNPAQGPPRGGLGVGGGGPMGEMVTGMAMQQELNSMSNAGANAAGSRARAQGRSIQTNQNQRHNAVMDELGL